MCFHAWDPSIEVFRELSAYTYSRGTLNETRTFMDTGQPLASETSGVPPSIHCQACQSALQAPSRQSVSYLLVDTLTVPLLGCADHLEQFRDICGLSTDGSAELLSHHPAGGIHCPRCRLSARAREHALIPFAGGMALVMSCPEHQSDIASRFQTGLRTWEQLHSSVPSSVDT